MLLLYYISGNSVCAHCFSSCLCTPLRKVCLHLPFTLLSGIYTLLWDPSPPESEQSQFAHFWWSLLNFMDCPPLQHLNLSILSHLLRPVLLSGPPLFSHHITFKHGACWQECSNIFLPTKSPLYKFINHLNQAFTSLNCPSFFEFSMLPI